MIIKINIAGKRPTVEGTPVLICGNSGDSIEFTFDSEWNILSDKIARFVYTQDGKKKHRNVPFTGTTVSVPKLSGIREVQVGVYAGDLKTTTSARIPCDYSILCNSGDDNTTGSDDPTLQEQIGDLSQLATRKKDDIVAAINEVLQVIGANSDELQDIREGYDGTIYPNAGESVRRQIMAVLNATATSEQIAQAVADYMARHPASGGGGLSITEDGNGNVFIVSSGSVSITDDGNGNVIIV